MEQLGDVPNPHLDTGIFLSFVVVGGGGEMELCLLVTLRENIWTDFM